MTLIGIQDPQKDFDGVNSSLNSWNSGPDPEELKHSYMSRTGEFGGNYAAVKTTCCGVAIFLGVVTNCLVLVAYLKKQKKSKYMFVLALSVCDLVNCLGLTTEILKTVSTIPEKWLRIMCLFQAYFTHFGLLLSAGLVLCNAGNRYLRIKYPQWMLSTKQRLALILFFVAAVGIVTSPYVIVYASGMVRGHGHYFICFCKYLLKNARSPDGIAERTLSDLVAIKTFLLTFYSVLLAFLMLTFLAIVTLYIGLVVVIRNKTYGRNDKSIRSRYSNLRCYNSKEKCDVSVSKRSSLTPSITSGSQATTFTRTFVMIVMSVVIFCFYFPNLVFHITSIEQKGLFLDHPVLSELLLNAQFVCFIINPVMFAYFNKGFMKRIRRC